MSPLRKTLDDAQHAEPVVPDRAELLETLAEAADPDERRGAAVELGRLLGPGPDDDAPGVLTALLGRVGVETDRAALAAVLVSLTLHDRRDVAEALVVHLASDDAALRNAVAEALSSLPNGIGPSLPALLADRDPDVRILTVMVLATLRCDGIEDLLTQLVENDPSPTVTAAAITELVPVAGPRCEGALLTARERFPEDPFITYAVTQALSAFDWERR